MVLEAGSGRDLEVSEPPGLTVLPISWEVEAQAEGLVFQYRRTSQYFAGSGLQQQAKARWEAAVEAPSLPSPSSQHLQLL